MALTFPSSPSNGQLYTDTVTGYRYIYNATAGVWSFSSNNVGMSVSSTPPSNVAPGSMWFNREIGRTFVYYDDGDSKQWIETVPAGAVDTNVVAGYVNPVFASMNTAYATANAGFGKANTALQNTSGVSTVGSFYVPNGNMGIGTTSPDQALTVSRTGSDSLIHIINNTTGNSGIYIEEAGNQGLTLQLNRVSNNFEWNHVSSGAMVFSNSGTERFRVDSSGRMTRPYNPAFFATGQNVNYAVTYGNNLIFNTLVTTFANSNRNSGYNTSTYTYTAPVSGLYYFYCQLFNQGSNGTYQTAWVKNGSILTYVDTALGQYQSGSSSQINNCSVIIDLSSGDSFSIQPRPSYSVTYYGGHSTFLGYLVG